MKKIVVLAEGAWGTAIATLAACNGYAVTLWCYHAEIAQEIQDSRTNSRYLPGIYLSDHIVATHDLHSALEDADIVFVAVPVQYLRSVLENARSCYRPSQIWVSLSKGIERDTLLLPSDIIAQVLDSSVTIVILSGPTFAREVATDVPTASILAAHDHSALRLVRSVCENGWFTCSQTTDVAGVQACGALKNVIALGIGMLEGAGYGQNTKALFLTRGLYDIASLTAALGGDRQTVYGLAGVGDLMLTAYGNLSKNFALGVSVGSGISINQALAATPFVPEGINTVQAVMQLMQTRKITLPVCAAVYQVLYDKKTVTQMVKELLT